MNREHRIGQFGVRPLTWIMPIVLAISACGQGIVSAPGRQDVEAQFDRSNQLVLDAAVLGCQSGSIGSVPVQVCDICTVIVSKRYREGLRINRRIDLGVPFRRALSRRSPDITPGPGQAGVWVVADNAGYDFHLDDDDRQAELPRELVQRAGGTVDGWDMPDSARRAFSADAELASNAIGLVGACANPDL